MRLNNALKSSLNFHLDDSFYFRKNASAGYGEQEILSRTNALISGIGDISLTAVEVNTDGKDLQKEVNKVLENLVSQMTHLKTKSPETAEYGKSLHDFCLSSEPIKTDVSSLDTAIQSLSFSKNRLSSQGALNVLHMMGKVCFIDDSDGSCVRHVVKTTWLTRALNVLMGPTGSAFNNGTVAFVADDTPVWESSQLQKAFQEHKLNTSTEASSALVLLMGLIGVDFSTKAYISLNHLKEQPPIAVDTFLSTKDNNVCENVTYTYLMSHQVPVPTMHQLLTYCLKLHSPIMLWATGCVVHDGIVEILLQLNNSETESSTLTLHAQTIKTEDSSAALMLWNTVEQYKLVLDSGFAKAGISTQIVCECSLQKPDSITGLTRSHLVPPGSSDLGVCKMCTTSARAIRLLQASMSVVSSVYFEANAANFEPESCGIVEGSSIVIKEKGTCNMITAMTAYDNNRVAITVLSVTNEPGSCVVGLWSSNDNNVEYNLASGKLAISEKNKHQNIDVPKVTSPGVVIDFMLSPLSELDRVQLDVRVGSCVVATLSIPRTVYKPFVRLETPPTDVGDTQLHRFEVVVQAGDFTHSIPIVQPGMRLEARDRLNPSLVCAATVASIDGVTGQWLIHFDGWTDRYDYMADPTTADIHPLGYMAFIGHKYKQYNPKIQAPKDYGKPKFDWAEYLKDIQEPPVPWELFSEEQKEGTPPDEINRALQTQGMFYNVSSSASNQCSSNRHRGAGTLN
ncbi:uncharacterized protein LOC121389672 [Gigantopelta aegis]|uniref:uncharacterized protein LOC121389672 n=1 Tax=Gigantopelta aegis TaxID=1735272 RepID=UPI001B887803|nr:uncharacterized protein LOC121389672 [Gigantopelta aegis]